MNYEMEELLPLVSELAQKYCGFESTSVTYETAQTLMGAVLYCLEEYHNAERGGLVGKNISIKEQYDTGLKLVYEKAEDIRKIFNELSSHFEDYGVRCLYDTVQKGIPQFLKWYDVKYHPQNTILTPDYPLLMDYSFLSGADAVYRYLSDIRTEQCFLKIFDKEYIVSVLKKYDSQYEYMVENICEIILTNMVGHVMIRKPIREMGFQSGEYLRLAEILEGKSVSDIKKITERTIGETVKRVSGNDADKAAEYLYHSVENIAVRIETAGRYHTLNKIFIV